MHAVIVDFPAYHPRVLQGAKPSLLKALTPRFAKHFAHASTTLTDQYSKLSPETASEVTIARVLHLLSKEQGRVSVRDAALDIRAHLPGSKAEAAYCPQVGNRLLDVLIDCSELIVVDSEGTTFTLHPEWATRLTKLFTERQTKWFADWACEWSQASAS